MKGRTCCFTGHRIIEKSKIPVLKNHLVSTMESLIDRGVLFYGCGGALGFDMLAGYTVLELREMYPAIKLVMVLPCRSQAEKWPNVDRNLYEILLSSADKIVYVSEMYYDGCLRKRNLHLVKNSGICIAYLKDNRSGTAQTVRFAKHYGLEVINLAGF